MYILVAIELLWSHYGVIMESLRSHSTACPVVQTVHSMDGFHMSRQHETQMIHAPCLN